MIENLHRHSASKVSPQQTGLTTILRASLCEQGHRRVGISHTAWSVWNKVSQTWKTPPSFPVGGVLQLSRRCWCEACVQQQQQLLGLGTHFMKLSDWSRCSLELWSERFIGGLFYTRLGPCWPHTASASTDEPVLNFKCFSGRFGGHIKSRNQRGCPLTSGQVALLVRNMSKVSFLQSKRQSLEKGFVLNSTKQQCNSLFSVL